MDLLYETLYRRLKQSLLGGQLPPGSRLPSTRQLAAELGVSRTTVVTAYEQLRAEGLVSGRIGSGTRVVAELPLFEAVPPVMARAKPLRLSEAARRAGRILFAPARGAPRPFRIGVPALREFPYEAWARALSRRARSVTANQLGYQDPAGFAHLRAAIVSHLAVARGVRAGADQVIVTAGAQGAIDLAVRALCDPGDGVWVEDPGFPGVRGALAAAGARQCPVPVDENGLDVAAGERRMPRARMAVVTPSHQFPTGAVMSIARRAALLDWAARRSAWIIEDDYDSEFRYQGRPIPALQGIDRSERVIHVGTFSKTLAPATRIGWMVAPRALMDALLAMRRFIDGHPPLLEQAALADFLSDGHYHRHARRMRALYGERRAQLEAALAAELPSLPFSRSHAGLHLCLRLGDGDDDEACASEAARAAIEVQPLSRYAIGRGPRGLLLGFGAVAPPAIRPAVRKLARAIR